MSAASDPKLAAWAWAVPGLASAAAGGGGQAGAAQRALWTALLPAAHKHSGEPLLQDLLLLDPSTAAVSQVT